MVMPRSVIEKLFQDPCWFPHETNLQLRRNLDKNILGTVFSELQSLTQPQEVLRIFKATAY